jgi:hypothetical protein
MVQEMMQTLDRLLPKLRLSPRSSPGSPTQAKVVPLAAPPASTGTGHLP